MPDDESIWIPFSCFGGEPAERPKRVAIRLANVETIEDYAGGAVTNPRTFDWDDDDRLVPIPYGLYAEDTFGPLPRTARGDVDLGAYDNPTFSRRPQLRRFGRIDLAAAVLHPWLARFLAERVDTAVGIDRFTWRAVLEGRFALDPSGALVEVATQIGADPTGWHFGRDALYALARERQRGREVPALRVLPVLPAGLRSAIVKNDRVMVRDASLLYRHVIRASDSARETLDAKPTVRDRATAHARVQRAVEALFLDGLDANETNAATPAAATLHSLGESFGGKFGSVAVADLARVTDHASLIQTLRGSLFIFRALVEASALEIVPLTEHRQIDEDARSKSLRDLVASTIQSVYDEQLGESWGGMVMHGRSDDPHVDVHAFVPRAKGAPAMLITAGMSTRPMLAAMATTADPFVEIVCLAPEDLDATLREDLMQSLLSLARYPFVRKTFFAPGHDVPAGAPIARDSALTAWAFYAIDEEWTERLSLAVPRFPSFLRAVGLTAEELEFKRANGSAALRERMEREGTWRATDPRRR